jgi:hypothetical protein
MIKSMRIALSIIGIAYLLLGLVLVLFSIPSPNIGAAYLSVWILAWGGTLAATGLCAGGVLGTVTLVRHPGSRRPLYVLATVMGWIGALGLGWLAWEFWTHS